MVTRDSDLTRLISGLARAGLVVRGTDSNDRRRSTNRITAAGRALLRRLNRDVADAAKQTLGHLGRDRKSTRLNSSHVAISYAVFCLKKKKNHKSAPTAASAITLSHRPPRS